MIRTEKELRELIQKNTELIKKRTELIKNQNERLEELIQDQFTNWHTTTRFSLIGCYSLKVLRALAQFGIPSHLTQIEKEFVQASFLLFNPLQWA